MTSNEASVCSDRGSRRIRTKPEIKTHLISRSALIPQYEKYYNRQGNDDA
jgi:hypothetical protein